ncbi:SpoIIE family protein phosphatase [Fodinicola acaciae]|uniref:SpoIIE family protein phosphatase n=1 Tax=Fodinicola acaciae TaxID=2681555 RepID=UPI0013D876B7|nr:SpoIIE family protein phosphatase [Fodinicola acaciae]
MTDEDDRDLRRLTELVAGQQAEIAKLRTAAGTDKVLHLACGVLVQQLHCTPAEASRQLLELANRSGVPPTELAADLVAQAAGVPVLSDTRTVSSDDVPEPEPAAPRTTTSGHDIADAVLDEVSRGTGAAGAILWRLSPDGALVLLGQSGLTSADLARFRHIPAPMDTLGQRVVRRREAIWLTEADAADVPLTGQWRGGRAVVPLIGPTLLGVLEVCWAEPIAEFPASLRRHLTSVAELCARTLDLRSGADRAWWPEALLDGVVDSGMFLHAVHDGDEVTDFQIDHVTELFADPAGRPASQLTGQRLAAVYPGLAVRPLFDQLVSVLRSGTAYRADHLRTVDILPTAAPGVVRLRVTRFLDGLVIALQAHDSTVKLGEMLGNVQRLGRIGGWEYQVADGRASWTGQTFMIFGVDPSDDPPTMDDLRRWIHPDDSPYLDAFLDLLLEQRQPASTTIRLVREDGTVRQLRASAEPVVTATGELVSVRGTFQDVSSHYHTEIALSATQDQLADTEDQMRQQARIALQLQRAILPPADHPLHLAGLEVVMRYQPPEEEHKVGGDWYDALELPGDRILITVGDVSGHGIHAATTMVAMRNGLRGLAVTGAAPAQLLSWLNAMLLQLYGGTAATAVCGLYDPGTRTMRWARAGHLPPLLVRDGEASMMRQPAGILLGVKPDAAYEEATVRLEPGDTLVMYTDGLVERRREILDDRLRQLIDTASRPVPDVEKFADELMLGADGSEDDTCVLVIKAG